jgi:regulator of RNase E activity RraA
MWPCPRIAGRAVTMKIKPVGLEKPKQHLGTQAIAAAQAGDIIVVDNGGRPDSSCWGGLLSLAAKAKGISGIVIDGACRDIDESRDVGFPVYACGAVPMTARGRVMQESFNREIQFAGVQVHPGDLVIADGSGVVIIPRAKEEDVIREAEIIAATEARMAEGIRQGLAVTEVLENLGYESMLETNKSR